MEGKPPIEEDKPNGKSFPIKKCDRCNNELPNPIFSTVCINNGKQVCDVCIYILIEENQKINEERNKQKNK